MWSILRQTVATVLLCAAGCAGLGQWPPAGWPQYPAVPAQAGLVSLPILPHQSSGKVCDVTAFGAKGDNATEDTSAIQAAMDACAIVVFPAGGAYLTRPIQVKKSGITVKIEPGAVIVVWGDIGTYNQTSGSFSALFWSNTSFLVQDTTFTGGGIIDGQGWRWWPFGKSHPRPQLIKMLSVQGWAVSNITLRDSPSFHLLARGDRLSVTSSRIEANLDSCGGYESAPNTDGLNVGGTNVFISDMFVHNGDDCIPLGDADVLPPYVTARNTQNVIAENVHCECGTNSGVTIVGAGPSVISDVVFRNFTAHSLNQGAGMKISEPYRNCTGEVRNVTWDGFRISSPRNTAVYINVYEEDAASTQCAMPSNPDRPGWMTASGLTFKNIAATDMGSAYAGCFACSPTRPCTDIRFDNVTIGTQKPYKCFNIQANNSHSSPTPCS